MKLKAHIVSVVLNTKRSPYIILGCSLNDFIALSPMLEDLSFKIWLESVPEDKIIGYIYSMTGSSSTKMEEGEEREAKCKIKILTPDTERIKVAELGTLGDGLYDFEISLNT